jgi:hypothetical protein
MSLRYLTNSEIALAKPVFRDSLPWNRITISPKLGFRDRPYTWGRTLNVGPYMYKGLDTATKGPPTFIHELTHVWQYQHRSYSGSYIFDSAAAQALHGDDAYQYEPGKPWDSYNAEQQAHIVQDWYVLGLNDDPNDPLFPYIRDVIRTKRIDPNDDAWKESDAATFQNRSQ